MLNILQSDELRRGFQRGMQVAADAVALTLGPCARPVFVGDSNAPLRVAQTGFAVATSIAFESDAESTGAALLREVADWARDASGDGTASAVAVAHHLLRECINLVGVGFDPIKLRLGIDLAMGEADNHLNLISRSGDDAGSLRHIAGTAAFDATLGDLVADIATQRVSRGLVVVDEGACALPHVASVNGIGIPAGFVFPRIWAAAGSACDRCRLHRPLVLCSATIWMGARVNQDDAMTARHCDDGWWWLSLASVLVSRRDNQDGWSVPGSVCLPALRDAADLRR